MSNRKAIVKKLPSVEALGCVSVICSDKTGELSSSPSHRLFGAWRRGPNCCSGLFFAGTLTKNEMTVTTIYTVDETVEFHDPVYAGAKSAALLKTIQVGNLCNNAFKNEYGVNVGQATDVAILNTVKTFGLDDQRQNFERTTEVPFSSEVKYMVVAGKLSAAADAQEILYMKGSIEAVLERCRFYHVSDSSTPSLDATVKNAVLNTANEVASKGLRVVAMAYGFGSTDDLAKPEGGQLVFAGFQAMMDPPRRGVADAIAALQAARIHVVMITGDAEPTALSIARNLGMKIGAGQSSCLTGKAIDQMSERQLQERVASVSVFARVTPKHKMSIIAAFQANGEVVAMTGDGGSFIFSAASPPSLLGA